MKHQKNIGRNIYLIAGKEWGTVVGVFMDKEGHEHFVIQRRHDPIQPDFTTHPVISQGWYFVTKKEWDQHSVHGPA